jgi:hypothetical protein
MNSTIKHESNPRNRKYRLIMFYTVQIIGSQMAVRL